MITLFNILRVILNHLMERSCDVTIDNYHRTCTLNTNLDARKEFTSQNQPIVTRASGLNTCACDLNWDYIISVLIYIHFKANRYQKQFFFNKLCFHKVMGTKPADWLEHISSIPSVNDNCV